MQPQPRLALDELLKDRSLLWHRIADTHTVNELEIRRLFNRLDQVIAGSGGDDSIAAAALHEQAYLQSYLMRVEGAQKLFQMAEDAGLPELAVSVSRAHSLYICGEIEMSERQILSADIATAGDFALAGLADCCVHTGLFKRASALYETSGREDGQVSMKATIAAQIMDTVGATDEQICRRIQAAAEVIKRFSSHPFICFDVFAMHGHGILYRFMVKAGTDHLLAIDAAVDQALSEKFDDPVDQVFSIGIAPYEAGAQIYAADGYYVGV